MILPVSYVCYVHQHVNKKKTNYGGNRYGNEWNSNYYGTLIIRTRRHYSDNWADGLQRSQNFLKLRLKFELLTAQI